MFWNKLELYFQFQLIKNKNRLTVREKKKFNVENVKYRPNREKRRLNDDQIKFSIVSQNRFNSNEIRRHVTMSEFQ